MSDPPSGTSAPSNFIKSIVERDLAEGRHGGAVRTRFPPEPNGYLHIGHAKAICLDFGIAADYGGTCNLRFDDTNPLKEEQEYIDAIKEDVRWLGFDWEDREYHAADYFEQLYEWAELLIRKGKAYVDDLSADEIREHRGTLTEPGRDSPHRNRSVEENLDLLRRMRAGEFPDGARVLRAKIDMAAGNLNMRDPVMYRILHAPHPRSGDAWCIYPTYDFTHGQSDSIERITHSLCTLEFEDHRPLYDWFIEELGIFPSRQYEFARLALTHTLMSKRKLKQLVDSGLVDGWDDPRMPTLSGMRRRGYTPEAIRDFCDRIGVAKANSTVDVAFLEHCLRQDLNRRAERRMAVLEPLKVVIEDLPEEHDEELEAINNPEDPTAGSRKVPFSRELWIDAEDFLEDPPRRFFRLAPGREVRLRYGYFITCTDVVKDDSGRVVEVRCTHDPETRGGQAPDGRKVRGTIHWVSARHAVDAEVRLYDHLFTDEQPTAGSRINPDSRQILTDCKLEPALAAAAPGNIVQFERRGYFCRDTRAADRLLFNRAVGLRDTWAKIRKQQGGG
jgi:glutaminyl-tRNA synthetase